MNWINIHCQTEVPAYCEDAGTESTKISVLAKGAGNLDFPTLAAKGRAAAEAYINSMPHCKITKIYSLSASFSPYQTEHAITQTGLWLGQ